LVRFIERETSKEGKQREKRGRTIWKKY
jgi:hypothetical protein